MVAELNRLEDLDNRTPRQVFLRFTTSVVSYAGIKDTERKRLLDQIVLASKGSHAADFAEAVTHFLHKDSVDIAEVWRRWLGKHLESRVNGLPRVASAKELANWANVVPIVGNFIPSAVALLSGQCIDLSDQSPIRGLTDEVLAAYGPELISFFAERIRNTPVSAQMGRYGVKQIIRAFRSRVDDTASQPLVEAATESGFLHIGH